MTNKCHENYVTKESCNSLPGCIQYKCNSRMIVCSVDLHQTKHLWYCGTTRFKV